MKLALGAAVAVLATLQMLYIQYATPLIEKDKLSEISSQGFADYMANQDNALLIASYGLCSMLAFAFITVLILHGIQTIVVRIMQKS